MILGTVNLRLTRKQTAALRKLWNESTEGKGPCYVIGQAAVKLGPFWVEPATAEFHVVDAAIGQRIQQGIDSAKGGTE